MSKSSTEHRDHKRQKTVPNLEIRMDEAMLKKCDAGLKQLMKRQQAVHFNRPVDWKKQGLPEYPKVIKQPMDLGTVQTKVSNRTYKTLEEMARDVRLVWKNAFLFNLPDSLYFKSARALNDAWEKKMAELEQEAEPTLPAAETMARCASLITDLRKNPMSEWFLEPVDHVGLGLTDYLSVVKSPMDLGTVQKKVDAGKYNSGEEFAADVRLVWSNGIAYNTAASMFGVVATCLSGVFERRYAAICRAPNPPAPGKPVPDRPGWPTFKNKKVFYDACTKLTLDQLNVMVGMAQKGCQGAVQVQGEKEVEIDVDELDLDTFNKVSDYAQKCIKEAPMK